MSLTVRITALIFLALVLFLLLKYAFPLAGAAVGFLLALIRFLGRTLFGA